MTGKAENEEGGTKHLSLSENEAKIYDRQIRLWGVRSQQRLMSSNVLMLGMSCVNVEVAKNLTLAGIRLTLVDEKQATSHDVTFNYFLRPADMGKTVSECTARGLSEMNPLAGVTHFNVSSIQTETQANGHHKNDEEEMHFFSNEKNEEKIKEFFKRFSCVCVAAEYFPFYTLVFLDRICRQLGLAFFASVCCGKMGMTFSDMNEHTIEESEIHQKVEVEVSSNGEKKAKLEGVFKFPPLRDTLNCPLGDFRQKTDKTFYLMFLLFRWEQQIADKVQLQNNGECIEVDVNSFLNLAQQQMKEQNIEGFVTEEQLRCIIRMYRRPFQPSAAVLGGLLAQEVRKYITKELVPLPNCIAFCADDSQAAVAAIPSS